MTQPPAAAVTERDELAERLRRRLADEPSLGEKAMFGSRAFMVRGKLVACAFKHGRLLVRVDAEREGELVARPGADRAVMAGRDMGAGWVSVDAHAIAADDDLQFWIDAALAYNRAVTDDRH